MSQNLTETEISFIIRVYMTYEDGSTQILLVPKGGILHWWNTDNKMIKGIDFFATDTQEQIREED